MELKKIIIPTAIILSLSVNLWMGYHFIILNRRTNASENINIDSNFLLDAKSEDKNVHQFIVNINHEQRSKLYASNFPITGMIDTIKHISQLDEFPNGCEAVSATMLLQYWNYDIEAHNFIDQYLDKEPITIKWGVRYGPNPKEAYAGDPRSKTNGFGCFSPVIENALNKVVKKDHKVLNLTGGDLDMLVTIFIGKKIPIAIWATTDMEELTSFCQWQSNDKKEVFLYPTKEHCLVLIGYDEEYFYFKDPLKTSETVKYTKRDTRNRFVQMGQQAVAIVPKDFSLENVSDQIIDAYQNKF